MLPINIQDWFPLGLTGLISLQSKGLSRVLSNTTVQTHQLFTLGGQVLEFQLQHQSFQWTPRTDLLQDRLVGSPCSLRDSQECCPTPQFKSISFSVFSFLYSPTLTSIHDYWKNHAAAKSLQPCLTLSDPMDCSLPGFSVPGIFQARVLEWGSN